MGQAIQTEQISQFAEQLYTEQKDAFIQGLTEHLERRIASGMAQIENGESMSFEDFEAKVRREILGEQD